MITLLTEFEKVSKGSSGIFNFVHEATLFHKQFPVLEHKIFFVDSSTNTLHGTSTPPLEHRALLEISQKRKVSFSAICQNQKTGVYLYAGNERNRHITDFHKPDIDLYFVFDHEAAHAIAGDKGRLSSNIFLAEAIADAYSALRHYQRFGIQSSGISDFITFRTARAFFEKEKNDLPDLAHFTVPALEALEQKKHNLNIAALSPADTFDLARQIATAATPNIAAMRELYLRVFWRHNDAMKESSDETPLRVLAEQTLSMTDDTSFRWGASVLKGIIDGKLDKFLYGKPRPSGSYWDSVRAEIEQRESSQKSTGPQIKPSIRTFTPMMPA